MNNEEQTVMTLEEALVEIERLKAENAEYLNGWQRAKADYVNFKQEQERRGKELSQFAGLSLISQLLPVQEYFRQALGYTPPEVATTDWYKGVEQIYKQLKEVMKGMGVEEYHAQRGDVLDPMKHEAVGQESLADLEDDVVTQEVHAGYMVHGKTIAPAKVIVNKKPNTAEDILASADEAA